jgi:hypothetical protein
MVGPPRLSEDFTTREQEGTIGGKPSRDSVIGELLLLVSGLEDSC